MRSRLRPRGASGQPISAAPVSRGPLTSRMRWKSSRETGACRGGQRRASRGAHHRPVRAVKVAAPSSRRHRLGDAGPLLLAAGGRRSGARPPVPRCSSARRGSGTIRRRSIGDRRGEEGHDRWGRHGGRGPVRTGTSEVRDCARTPPACGPGPFLPLAGGPDGPAWAGIRAHRSRGGPRCACRFIGVGRAVPGWCLWSSGLITSAGEARPARGVAVTGGAWCRGMAGPRVGPAVGWGPGPWSLSPPLCPGPGRGGAAGRRGPEAGVRRVVCGRRRRSPRAVPRR